MLVVPAMHELMGLNPAVRESLDKLRSWGVGIVSGATVEGENKIASPEEVAAAVLHRIASGPWTGRRVVVIGGAARESLDEVRSLTNESSGASAVALAVQAHFRGADVALWVGALQVPIPPFLHPVPWRSVGDLLTLARDRSAELASAASVLVPAALSDFTVDRSPGKIRSAEHATLSVTLHHAPKVLPELRRLAPRPVVLVAFKLLAGGGEARLEEEGRRLRRETQADWVVANDVATMGSADTNALVLPPRGTRHWIRATKLEFAGRLLDEIGRELAGVADDSRPAPAQGGSRRHRSIGRRTTRGRGAGPPAARSRVPRARPRPR